MQSIRKNPAAHERFTAFREYLLSQKASRGQIKNYTWLGGRFIKVMDKSPTEWKDEDFAKYFKKLVGEKRNYHYINTTAAALRKLSIFMANKDRTDLIDQLRKTSIDKLHVKHTDRVDTQALKAPREKAVARRNAVLAKGAISKTDRLVKKTIAESLNLKGLFQKNHARLQALDKDKALCEEKEKLLTRLQEIERLQGQKISA